MRFVDSNKYGATSERQISEFEKLIKIRLPGQYRSYLLSHNGAVPNKTTYDFDDTSSNIHCMYGLNGGPEYQELTSCLHVFEGRIANGYVAIGSDGLGNQICIGLRGNARGGIYFWDHEKEHSVVFKRRNLTKISDSFNEFISSLYEYIDPDETLYEKIVRERNVEALKKILFNGFDVETILKHNRTLIEMCAIAAADDMIVVLHGHGAKCRESILYAKKNAKYFDKHRITVKILNDLYDSGE